jgi:hypothetical protein
MRVKIPSLASTIYICQDKRDKDAVIKAKMSSNADQLRRARPSDLNAGDQILVRQQLTHKLSAPFYPTSFTIVSKERNAEMVKSPDRNDYVRNSTFVKKAMSKNTTQEAKKNWETG